MGTVRPRSWPHRTSESGVIRPVVVTATVVVMVVVTAMVVVFLAFGLLVVVARRVVGAVLGLGSAPAAERQNAGDPHQSGHSCGSLDHRRSFAWVSPGYYPNRAEVHASFAL